MGVSRLLCGGRCLSRSGFPWKRLSLQLLRWLGVIGASGLCRYIILISGGVDLNTGRLLFCSLCFFHALARV